VFEFIDCRVKDVMSHLEGCVLHRSHLSASFKCHQEITVIIPIYKIYRMIFLNVFYRRRAEIKCKLDLPKF